jgi:alanine-synthesizing transaminase
VDVRSSFVRLPIGDRCNLPSIRHRSDASSVHLYNDAPKKMLAKRTNWNLETNRLSAALAAHRAAGKPLIDLTVSNPTECGFQYDEEAVLGALRNPSAMRYEPNPRGLDVARGAVARYYGEREAAVLNDDIFLTTSTSEAYSFVFRTLCDPEDELLIPEPSYPLFEFLADIQDVRLVRYPLVYDHGWQIDFHALEQAMTPRTRGVIVVHPNNPTGHFVKPEETRKMNEICAAREIAIIADEVFLDFALRDVRPATFAANPSALTFTMSGLSKICGLPQMKAAWLIVSGPEAWKAEALARIEVIADTYLSMNAPVQWAMPVLLAQRYSFQKQLMARVKENLSELDRQLAEQKPCSRLEVEGGWNAVLRVPATRSDEELALELLATKSVYVHPGHFYDFPRKGYLVVSLITPTPEFAQGIKSVLSMY